MHKYEFNIGDLLRVNGKDTISISAPGENGKQYKDCLRVTYRFWDGLNNVYVVATEDGTELIILESEAELQEAASEAVPEIKAERDTTSRPADDRQEKALAKFHLGYVYEVNNRLVAASTIKDAIDVFHCHAATANTTIEKVILQSTDLALIQNITED